jgi:hypothetical protein
MTQPSQIFGPELQRRRILFAAALIDPITGATVSEGLRVSVDKLTSPPIISRSKYFIWLAEEPLRPTTLTIAPGRAPFEPDISAIPALPAPAADDPSAPIVVDNARLLRIFLRPTAAYPFPDNALVLRGTLRETTAANAAPVLGARIAIEWKSEPTQMGGAPVWVVSAAAGRTDSRGAFAAALALPARARPLTSAGKDMTVRIRVDRGSGARISNDIELPAASGDPVAGRGNNWSFKDPIAWSGLTPV